MSTRETGFVSRYYNPLDASELAEAVILLAEHLGLGFYRLPVEKNEAGQTELSLRPLGE